MEQLAPARSDETIDSVIKDGGARLEFEKLNAALEDRAIDVEFTGHEFAVVRDPKPLDGRTEDMITAMHDAFKAAMAELQVAPIMDLPDAVAYVLAAKAVATRSPPQ